MVVNWKENLYITNSLRLLSRICYTVITNYGYSKVNPIVPRNSFKPSCSVIYKKKKIKKSSSRLRKLKQTENLLVARNNSDFIIQN